MNKPYSPKLGDFRSFEDHFRSPEAGMDTYINHDASESVPICLSTPNFRSYGQIMTFPHFHKWSTANESIYGFENPTKSLCTFWDPSTKTSISKDHITIAIFSS